MKDYIYIGIIAALFLVFFMLHIIQSSRISKLMKRYEAFMEGKDATNLADAIEENFQQMEKLESSYQDAEVKMDKALSGITSTFHKLGIVKYDAFKEMGGNLSFALCLLDGESLCWKDTSTYTLFFSPSKYRMFSYKGSLLLFR